MKILVDSNIPLGKELFGRHGQVEFFEGRGLLPDKLQNADALITRSVTKVDKALLEKSRLRFVGTATIGTDHIDLEYLKQKNMGFSYAPGCNCNAVGDYVISVLAELKNRGTINLDEKTLGIVGFGNVGKNLYPKAKALGLNVLACDPPLDKKEPGAHPLVDYNTLMENAHILSFHVPLTTEGEHPTKGMINKSFLGKLPKTEVIINTSRGPLLNVPAIMEYKQSERLKALVLDVMPDEPNISRELVNICEFVTPHIAGYSAEGKHRGSVMIYQEFCRFFDLPLGEITWPLKPIALSLKWEQSDTLAELHDLIKKVFDLSVEDVKLRKSLECENPGRQFDLLRKNFPTRRDFSAYQLSPSPSSLPLPDFLKELGFQLS